MIQAYHADGTPLSLTGKTSAESMVAMLTIEDLHHIRVYPDADTTDMLGVLLKPESPINRAALRDAEQTSLKAWELTRKLARLLNQVLNGNHDDEWESNVRDVLAQIEYQPLPQEIPHEQKRLD